MTCTNKSINQSAKKHLLSVIDSERRKTSSECDIHIVRCTFDSSVSLLAVVTAAAWCEVPCVTRERSPTARRPTRSPDTADNRLSACSVADAVVLRIWCSCNSVAGYV